MTKSLGFAFDIDGVLLRGGVALKGARPALDKLISHKIPWILLTNGGGMSERDRVNNLTAKLEVPIRPSQFLQSHTPFQQFIGNKDRVLVVGGKDDKCRRVASGYGFKDVVIPADIVQTCPNILPFPNFTQTFPGAKPLSNLEKPFDGIFVFHDSRDATADIQVIMDLLLSKKGVLGTRRESHGVSPSVPIYFSNGDMQWASDYPQPRFGQGALIESIKAIYRAVTGHELEHSVIGKPQRLTYEYANKLLPNVDTVFMVGDNQYSDIRGANNFGWESVLVETGVYRPHDKLFTRPSYICKDVLDAVETVIRKQSS